MSRFTRKDPSKLQQQLETYQNKGFQDADDAVWKLAVDKNGNGKAVIRFLPGKTEEDLPLIKLINHGFKQGSKWYIQNCSSTHGDFDSCPVCVHLKDKDLYNTDKSAYDRMKRKTSYWANVLIISDAANPENNGKVFKYRFGKKIFDKIQAQASGDVDLDIEPVDVTCPFDGADFVLIAKKVGEHLNYDDSTFKNPSPIKNIDDPDYQEELFEMMHDIKSISSADKFKSKEELDKEFGKLMGNARQASAIDDFDAEMKSFEEAKNTSKSKSEPAIDTSTADKATDIDPEIADLLDL